MNILNSKAPSLMLYWVIYISLRKYLNFQNVTKLEQSIEIVTARSVSCLYFRFIDLYPYTFSFYFIFKLFSPSY